MFIVAMTLAVIAAMGVYALKIASTEVKTAGFVRQQVQSQYLAQFGVTAAAQALSGGNAQLYDTLMLQSPDTGCYSLFGTPAMPTANAQSVACHRAGSVELGTEVVPSSAGAVTLVLPVTSMTSDSTRGSVGIGPVVTAAQPSAADFYVEVTDPNQRQPPPGFATNSNLCFIQFTASSFGLTPTISTTNAGDSFTGATYGYLSEGLQIARARIMSGPVTCSGTN
jgi:hypothetical protein